MQLFVRSPVSGRTIVLNCEKTSTIAELKDELWAKEGISADKYQFHKDYNTFSDKDTVESLSLQPETTLEMKFRVVKQYQISIKSIKGYPPIRLIVPESMLIEDLKKVVAEREGSEESQVQLIFSGRVLEENVHICEEGIKSGSVLYSVTKQKKCSCESMEPPLKRARVIGGCVYDPSGNQFYVSGKYSCSDHN